MLDICLLLGSLILTLIIFGLPVLFTMSILFHWHILVIILIGLCVLAELMIVMFGFYHNFRGEINK